jgi:ABC-2 type transport system ATP-binding protein
MQMKGDPVLVVEDLSKTFILGIMRRKTHTVLSGVSFTVCRGEILGYLGPNGSGKTTTLKIVVGLMKPSGGRVSVLGSSGEDRSWRRSVGFLPEHPYFYDYLTAMEYLDYVGRLFGLTRASRRERTHALIERVGLRGAACLPIRRYSKGMVQRLGIAQALINDPAIVFLDEPMSGLDPIGRHLVKKIILDLKQEGRSVLFSTHILPDAETLCDRIALLRAGTLVATGRLDEILSIDVAHIEIIASGVDRENLGAAHDAVRSASRMGERLKLQVDEGDLGRVIQAIEHGGGRVLAVQPIRQSLEEYFFKEAGGEGRDGSWMIEA